MTSLGRIQSQTRGRDKLAENGEARRSACGRNVVRQMALRRECERRELDRLFVLRRNPELVGKSQTEPNREAPLLWPLRT